LSTQARKLRKQSLQVDRKCPSRVSGSLFHLPKGGARPFVVMPGLKRQELVEQILENGGEVWKFNPAKGPE